MIIPSLKNMCSSMCPISFVLSTILYKESVSLNSTGKLTHCFKLYREYRLHSNRGRESFINEN